MILIGQLRKLFFQQNLELTQKIKLGIECVHIYKASDWIFYRAPLATQSVALAFHARY